MMDTTQPNQLRILIADDEESVLSVYRQVLAPKRDDSKMFSELGKLASDLFGKKAPDTSTLSCELMTCCQGKEAVEAVKKSLEENRPFAVAFLDVRMPPGPDGIWTAEQIRDLDPQIEIVIVTGYSDIDPRDIAHRVPPIYKLLYIQKPLHPQEIYQFTSALGLKWLMECELREINEALEDRVQERTVELMKMNEHLKEEKERHRIVLESTPDSVIVYDVERCITYFNPAFSRLFGWTLRESIGRDIDFVPVEKLPEARSIFAKIHDGKTVTGIETCRLTRDGKRIDVSIGGAGFFDAQGTLQGSIITLQDITARKHTEEKIKFLAYHDVLTGLSNRKSFYMRLEDEVRKSRKRAGNKRRGEGHTWALFFLDLDKFKYINDTLGHDTGDEVLKLVVARIQNCLRESDHIFRLGGDEFTIILPGFTCNTDIAKVAQKIRREVARPYSIKDHKFCMTISIGISVYPDDGDDVETLVKNADMAMYAAKQKDEGYHFFTEEMNRKALERINMESSLRDAIQNHQLVMYYQPMIDDSKRIIGIEALLRWHHPELGLLDSSQFITLAEETGIIIPIGKWVLHTACQQVKKWHDMGRTGLYVAINLSTRQFREASLVESVEQALAASALPPDCLKLEVTESGVLESPEEAIAKMKILREKGVRFSIDNFGTGYSSLSYLKRLPIDTLKIDRSFIIDSTSNEDDREIIKTIISIARNLGIETIAGGVETEEQRNFLLRHGCRMMQGYYLGRPIPADKFEEMLQNSG